ncbi:hypothetical protein ACQ4PT_027765 [Festuca glaucescens]
MEFSRRGPATDAAADGNRFPEPPPHPHGEQDPMLAARDALLSQLHMDRRHQEINKEELAKIERVMFLHATTAGGHKTTPMPWHGVVTADHGRSKPWLFSADQPVAQRNAEFDECKLPDSNKAVPPSKTPPTEKWELTGITIPVKKPKPPTVCQVQATSGHNLQQHYAGQKHLSNVAAVDPTIEASDQKAETAAKPSLSIEEKKTSSVKWSCSTCQANGTSQSTLDAHLKGKRHQQNIAATCVEGDRYGMSKNVMPQEAKSHSINVARHSEKLPSAWSCNICQVVCTCQTDLKNHLKGIRHREKVQSLLEQSKKKASDSESHKSRLNTKPPMKWSCTVCQVQATSEQNLQQHYAGQKHLSNVATLVPRTKESDQKAKTAAEPSLGTEQKKISSIKWSCSTCLANGTSQSTLESHLKSKRHQLNIAEASVEGDKNGMPRNVMVQEGKSHGINVPKNSEEPPSDWICSICQVFCTCQIDLKNHLKGIRHREKVQSLLEQNKDKASDSESWKSKLNPDSRWICSICHAHCTCESDLENHLRGKRHQLNIHVLREKIKQEKHNPPQIAKNEEPPSEWNCTMCEAKCNSESQFGDHCRSSRHRQMIHAILRKGKFAKASSSRTANELPSDG